jgi:Na+-transporting NADH:ubiquinone oxidoreductase subunit NqrB
MKELKWITALPVIIGAILIVLGWIQSWEHLNDGNNDYMFTIRTIRTYVFIIGGLILILNGILFHALRKTINNLEMKIYVLKNEIEKK